jgi:hypothetical protein
MAGRRLTALAALLRSPIAGRRLARATFREALIAPLRRRMKAESEPRAVIPYRPEPRRPE